MLRNCGYTLVECLLCLALAGLLAALAVPAFTRLQLENRMAATVNDYLHGMHVGRVTALARGREVALCRSSDGRRCTYGAAWQAGFIVFENRDQDSPPQVDPGEVLLTSGAGNPGLVIQSNRTAFVFRPYGKRSVNGTLTFCDDRGAARARALIVSYTGRPRATAAASSSIAVKCPS